MVRVARGCRAEAIVPVPDPLSRAVEAGGRDRGCIIDEGEGSARRRQRRSRQGPSGSAQPRAKHFACSAEPRSRRALAPQPPQLLVLRLPNSPGGTVLGWGHP